MATVERMYIQRRVTQGIHAKSLNEVKRSVKIPHEGKVHAEECLCGKMHANKLHEREICQREATIETQDMRKSLNEG